MKARNLLFLLLLLLVACTPVQVIITATPNGTPAPTVVQTVTVEPSSTPRPTVAGGATPTREVAQRDCMRISYNINGFAVGDWEYLKQHLVALQPCSVLMMDDAKRALDLVELLPNTLVIWRGYSKHEGGQCIADPPHQQVDRFVELLRRLARELGMPEDSYRRMALYGCSNEPSYGGNTALSQILTANIEFMKYAREEYDLTVVSGNWGVGNFDPLDVESGVYHDYLVALETYNQLMGVHEYSSLFIPFGTGLFTRECLYEGLAERRNPCVQSENWPTVEDIQPQRWHPAEILTAQTLPGEDPQIIGISELSGYYYSLSANAVGTGFLPPYWHFFRSLWLDIYALEHGIERPTKILTESFHDHLNDIDRVAPDAIQPLTYLESIFGIEQYMFDIRGAPSHCRLYEEYYYPDQTCSQSLFDQYEWWDTVADGTYHSANIFTWSDTRSDSISWKPFNLSGRDSGYDLYELHDLLEEYAIAGRAA